MGPFIPLEPGERFIHDHGTGWPDGVIKKNVQRWRSERTRKKKHPEKVFSDTTWQHRQLEHLGDAILYVAARVIAQQRHGGNTGAYFLMAQRLISNYNFRTHPGIKNAATFEVIVGDAFVRFGITAATDLAMMLLKETAAYHATA